jgi:putative transposase
MPAHQAFRFALAPNNAQRSALASHAGAARFVFNWGLALVKARLDERAVGRDVVVPWSLPALRREWNQVKGDVAPWWAENSKEAYSSGLDALARGLRAFADAKAGRRQGRPVGFPRFRKKGRCRRSCRFTTGAIRVVDDRHVRLPRIGVVRTAESTGKLAGRLAAGTARILSASIVEDAGRWFVSFTCEVDREQPRRAPTDPLVGVDVGVSHLAVIAGPTTPPVLVANPRPLGRYQRRMARLQRELARRQPGSRRRVTTRRRLARCHRRVRDLRRDRMAKLTTSLARTHKVVVVEDLHVAGMTGRAHGRGRAAKAGLNRVVLDASLAELRRQLTYKSAWYGSGLVVADRWFPSSKTCSACGWRTPSLPLSARTFDCAQCGLIVDRDVNAARNLAKVAIVASAAEMKNGRGGAVRPSSACSDDGSFAEASTGQPAPAGVRPGALGHDPRSRSDR